MFFEEAVIRNPRELELLIVINDFDECDLLEVFLDQESIFRFSIEALGPQHQIAYDRR